MADFAAPLAALTAHRWFKLINGASFQDVAQIYNLTLAYTLAGADCIDVAADPAVIHVANDALTVAERLGATRPLLMVSINDGADPHFRKATFDPHRCPPGCDRPCERICPAQAIQFNASVQGVLRNRCYGCGRCLPLCPLDLITTDEQPAVFEDITPSIADGTIQALEIHTQPQRYRAFAELWQRVHPWVRYLQVLAISCPQGEGVIDYLRWINSQIQPLECVLIWQADGRPMSGDIGDGATRATIQFGQAILGANLPGFVQLAGGTNGHTVAKLRAMGLLAPQGIAGVAYGSYARKRLAPFHAIADQPWQTVPAVLAAAVAEAATLVSPLKSVPSPSVPYG
ncbi:MAG: LdpA C-terminal domain-containing domain [Thermosynechococcus sp. Uc]|uniref:circadian clock protein LdpA n=1 Tax=Thermosynechococcus sp. Uc TaxID=3034853 RepID=UPI00259EF5CF|nr:LdpA C-terminal domain-containing domain [Thermosynechococcus sp. Uc]MDM7327282.1 LdpA C-terminal domain-containing domain [Thermosynechococcus sp. Uc]